MNKGDRVRVSYEAKYVNPGTLGSHYVELDNGAYPGQMALVAEGSFVVLEPVDAYPAGKVFVEKGFSKSPWVYMKSESGWKVIHDGTIQSTTWKSVSTEIEFCKTNTN